MRLLRLAYGALVFAVIVAWNPAHCEVLAQEDPLRLTVYPRICGAGCDVRVEVFVPRHSDNRYLFIGWDGEQVSSSLITLDGENAMVIHTRMMLSLPSGEYEVFTTLVRINAKDRSKLDHLTERSSVLVN